MKWPPAAKMATAHSMDLRTRMLPVVQRMRSSPSSHGKPQGCCGLRTGCGPRPLEYCALDQELHGGIRMAMS
eukprot:736519-Heterocapsa_arctica.AAC.1